MPIHDWTRVDAGLFHAFHHGWVISLCNSLNWGKLPRQYFALPEQHISAPIPDVLTLQLPPGTEEPAAGPTPLAVAIAPPQTRYVRRCEVDAYAGKADQITIRHRHGHVVAVIEIVSAGNKSSRNALRAIVEKTSDLIRQGIHLLVIDLFPPSPRDPQGLHKAIWDEFLDEEFVLSEDKPPTLAAYDAGPPRVAYVEPVSVRDALPDMPLFLKPEVYIPAPLESTYLAAWEEFPAPLKGLLE